MDAPLQIDLYDDIWAWTVRNIVDRMRANPTAEVVFRINSPGGDVTEGFALANAIKEHTGRTIAVVEGVCASAATFPLCACDEVQMHSESLEIVEGHAMPDHVHMCLSIPPKYAVTSVVGFLKGKSAVWIFREFEGQRRNFGGMHFWARGYFVSTVGRDEETIRNYIKNQEEEDKRMDQLQLM